jgi:preprotein translocase subunit YajC
MLNLLVSLVSSASAQEAAAAPQQGGFASMIPFILIFLVFYFLMIRPQKKKMQQEQDLLKALKKGDEIYTKSGILGKISGLTEKIVTIEVAEGTRLKVLRSQVGGLSNTVFEKKEK